MADSKGFKLASELWDRVVEKGSSLSSQERTISHFCEKFNSIKYDGNVEDLFANVDHLGMILNELGEMSDLQLDVKKKRTLLQALRK